METLFSADLMIVGFIFICLVTLALALGVNGWFGFMPLGYLLITLKWWKK